VLSSLGLLRDVAGMLDEGLVALDDSDRVLVASGTAFEVLGISAADAGGLLQRSRTDYRVLRLIEAARSTGSPQSRDITAGTRELVVRAVPVRDNDVQILLLARDESRIRHLERVRRDFISNVSHELRTPVTAVRLMAETLEAGALDDRDAAADFVRRIALEATHMAQMLEELLELSTIESGLRPIVAERVPLLALVAMVDRLRPLAEAKDQSIEVRVTPGTPDVRGDASRLGQVLRNLLHNAIKFTPAGGHIEIEAEPGDGDTVVLRCRDNGVGIAPADVQRIFERFWKADNSRQRDGEGSGLGLAIVRHVVEAHGGTVSVSSEPRRGTIFTVVLPAAA
jgi:two-component system, OmpR family, phosphate regulon sensor histidine kinase PhoR